MLVSMNHKWERRLLKKSLLVNRLNDNIYNIQEHERAQRNKRVNRQGKQCTNQNNLKHTTHTDLYTNKLH